MGSGSIFNLILGKDFLFFLNVTYYCIIYYFNLHDYFPQLYLIVYETVLYLF